MVYCVGDVRILYVKTHDYVIQYNWRQSSHDIIPLHPNPSYHISHIIFWQDRFYSHRNKWTINLDAYHSLLQDAPHLQNPRWDAQDATEGTLPPFEGDWERYNPFKPSVNIVNNDLDSKRDLDLDPNSDADSDSK